MKQGDEEDNDPLFLTKILVYKKNMYVHRRQNSFNHRHHRMEKPSDGTRNYDWHYFENRLNNYVEYLLVPLVFDWVSLQLISPVFLRRIVSNQRENRKNATNCLRSKRYSIAMTYHLRTAIPMKLIDLFLTFLLTIIVQI